MNLGFPFSPELPSVAEASPQPPVSLPYHLPPFNSSFHPAPCLSLGSPESEFEPQIWMQSFIWGSHQEARRMRERMEKNQRRCGMELLNVMGSCPLGPSEARVRDL